MVAIPLTHKRRLRCLALCPEALKHFDRLEANIIDADRASGLAMCGVCNHQLFDHPHHPRAPELTITCEGKFVKL